MKPHGHQNNPHMLQMAHYVWCSIFYTSFSCSWAWICQQVPLVFRGADASVVILAQASHPLETHIVLQRAKQLMEG